jgi:hypothetical protein
MMINLKLYVQIRSQVQMQVDTRVFGVFFFFFGYSILSASIQAQNFALMLGLL